MTLRIETWKEVQKDMDEHRSPQEYAYIMDGITTRMQLAIQKMSESNKMFKSTLKWVCTVMLIVIMIVVGGFIVETKIFINHVNNIRNSTPIVSEVTDEKIPEFGQRTGN